MTPTSRRTEMIHADTVRRGAAAALSASLLALAACGGGGGGGGGGAGGGGGGGGGGANVPPAVTVEVSDAAPHEGQTFTLDATKSTDGNNDTLTFSWVQTGGQPHIDIPNAKLARLANLRVPELTATANATFEVTVSDGKASSKKSVTVALTNIHQMPRNALVPPLVDRVTLNGSVEAEFLGHGIEGDFLGLADLGNGSVSVVKPRLTAMNELVVEPAGTAMDTFQQPASFSERAPLSTDPDRSSFIVADGPRNRVSGFIQPDTSTPFALRGEITIASPCTVVSTYDANGLILAGSRHGGLHRIGWTPVGATGPLDFTELQALGTNESFCAIALPFRSVYGTNFTMPTQNLEDVVALDVDTNTIHVFEEDVSGGPAEYKHRNSVDVNLDTTEDLTLIKSLQLPFGLALLYTDGHHKGTHRLVFVGFDADRKVVQETYSWAIGVPSDIDQVFIGSGQPSSLVITSATSPDAIVFEFQDYQNLVLLPLNAPTYMDIGLGNTTGKAIYPLDANGDRQSFFLTSKRSTGEARLFGLENAATP